MDHSASTAEEKFKLLWSFPKQLLNSEAAAAGGGKHEFRQT
jgi:hypothetical protein